jgi:hypothetical protein
VLTGNTLSNNAKSSIWWRDIIGLERENDDNWFMSNIGSMVGDGKNIGFWRFKWYGGQSFSALFPDLFAKEAVKDVLISERLKNEGTALAWSWQWSQQLTPNEVNGLEELKELLVGFSLIPDCPDRWRWKSGSMGLFSVRSCYSILNVMQPTVTLDGDVLATINKLWRIDVPSKALVFGWRFLLDKLLTRSALNHRGILTNSLDLHCIFCSQIVEDCDHLFFSFQFSKGIWGAISRWLGKTIPTGVDRWTHFLMFGDLVSLKKGGGRVNRLIWLATMWSIWKHMNEVIFKGNQSGCYCSFE